MPDPLREVLLPRLERVRPSGGSYMALCPAHEDRTPSLSVGAGRDQPVVITCHAGCPPETILERLGLTWADLSHPPSPNGRHGPRDASWTPAGRASATYDYVDETGKLLFQVLRTEDKQFRQRVPDGGGWTWRLGDTRRVLYRLPAVMTAINEGRMVWIAEGEKDVHAIEKAGFTATCNPGGAGKWRPEYTELFREAVVTIVADRDSAGRAHARTVRDALLSVDATVRVVEATHGKDAADHLASGNGLESMTVTFDSEEPGKPAYGVEFWAFVNGEQDPYDWLVPKLIERGDRLILTGWEGEVKSTLIRQMAVNIGAGYDPFARLSRKTYAGRKILLVDCENSPRQNWRAMQRLAADARATQPVPLPEGNFWIEHVPGGMDLTRDDDAEHLRERLHAHRPDVLFIGSFYKLHRANINDELPARKVIAVLDNLRAEYGCAVIIEAHAPHGASGSARLPRPAGSSLLLRWPEFGLGLTTDPDHPGDSTYAQLEPWRGGRDDRDWPRFLKRGDKTQGEWPWIENPAKTTSGGNKGWV